MNKILLLPIFRMRLLPIICFLTCSLVINAEIHESFSYSETFSNNGTLIATKLLNKDQRIRSNVARINIQDNNVPDSIQKCVLYAIDIWESALKCQKAINIELYFQPLGNDIETDVIYMTDNDNDYIPYALYKNLFFEDKGELSDGKIFVNSDKEWDCSVGENLNPSKPNLTFALLRSLAKILGFGSTVKINDDNLLYFGDKRYYSKYDRLTLSSDNESITKFELMKGKANKELTDYYFSNNRSFFISKIDPYYELEKNIAIDKSVLSYLKTPNSLMSYAPKIGAYYLQIDSITLSVLEAIGWEVNKSPFLEITCDDADNNGIMSAYESHKFYINSPDLNKITDPVWKLSLPLTSGGEEIFYLGTGTTSCTVPSIQDEEKYQRNVNGDIYAYLDFSCLINGKTYNADTYRISFELKPHIEYARIIEKRHYSERQTYDVYYEVKYYGTDHITVSVEEEYGSWLKTKTIREPYLMNGICSQITAPFYAWIDFTVENKYGKDVFTIELGPNGETLNTYNNNLNISPDITDVSDINHPSIKFVEVYNLQGHLIGNYRDLSTAQKISEKGIYIIREVLESGQSTTHKLIIP